MLLRVNVDAPDDKITEFGAGAKLYWYRDNTSGTGTFVDATGSVTLVATQSQYEIVDSTGAVGHYYRTRIGNTGGTVFDTYAPVFQAGAITAYATLDALRENLSLTDNSQDNLLSDLLVQASRYLDEKTYRDFQRHPQVSGTEVRTYSGVNRASIDEDIISLSLVEYSFYSGGTYATLASNDYFLHPDTPRPGWPYTSLTVNEYGTSIRYFFRGQRTVRLTGAFGWSAVPDLIVKATLDLAREWYRQGPGGGGPVGVNQFGTPIFGGGLPGSVRDAIGLYGHDAVLVA